MLNNINISDDYLGKLTAEIEQDCANITSLSEHALEKAKTVLSGLGASSNTFRQILNSGIEQLFGQTVNQKLRALLLDSYKDIKYVVSDEEYAEQEASNRFVHRFMSGFDTMIEPYKVKGILMFLFNRCPPCGRCSLT